MSCKYGSGCQAILSELAESEAFRDIVKDESENRSLDESKILSSVGAVYHESSKHGHGNTGLITLYHQHHSSFEVALLAAFLRLQEGWDIERKLEWREIVALDCTEN